MVILVVTLLALQAPDPAGHWQEECRALVDKGALQVAADCYRHAAANAADDAQLALALADVLLRLELPEPKKLEQPRQRRPSSSSSWGFPSADFDLGDFALSGGAEVAALGFVDGVVVGFVLDAMLVSATGVQNGPGAVVLLALPFFGGVAGFGAGLTAMLALDRELSDGDVHLIRAGLIVAPYEAATTALLLVSVTESSSSTPIVAAGALVSMGLTIGASAAGAALFDVDPSAPSLALSFGWIGGVVGGLVVAAIDPKLQSQQEIQIGLVATSLGAHAGLAAGFALAPALQVSRPAILLVDAGAVVGLLGGTALAFGMRAPNPALGYGTIATATVIGAAAGVVGAVLVPDLWAEDP
ncbi:MAG: hypothetical protein Q8O67_22325 [Deltaproteobacteria bacterium]|nr:hypothetical protein [Deltaproteobacteria bacterium]